MSKNARTCFVESTMKAWPSSPGVGVAAESVESVGWRCADGRTGGWAAAMLQKGHAGDILCN